MPARRKSAAVLRLSGSMAHDAKRYAQRNLEPQCMAPLGEPPGYFSEVEAECWREIQSIAPTGVLHRRDRLIVEEAAGLLASIRVRGFGNAKAAQVARFESCCARLGLSPSDGARVQVAPAESNEFDEFTRTRRR